MPIAWVDVPDPHNPPAGAPKLSAANLARLALIEDIGVAGTPTGDAGRAVFGTPTKVRERIEGQHISRQLTAFQSGHGWTVSLTNGATWTLNDTSDAALGSQCVSVVTGTTGARTELQSPTMAAIDLTKNAIKVWFRVDPATASAVSKVTVFFGENSTSGYGLDLWVNGNPSIVDPTTGWFTATFDLSFAYTVNAPTTKTAITTARMVVYPNNGSAAKVYFGGVAVIDKGASAFPNGVVTFGFDDGYLDQYTVMKPWMDRYGFPATAYVIQDLVLASDGSTSSYMDLAQLHNLEDQSGWEIAAHSLTVADHNLSGAFTALTEAQLRANLEAHKRWLLAEGFRGADHFAYPQGIYNDATVKIIRDYFTSARSTAYQGALEQPVPAYPQRMRCVAVNSTDSLATLTAHVDRVTANGGWLQFYLHRAIASPSGVQTTPAIFTGLVDYVAASGADVRTVGQVLDRGVVDLKSLSGGSVTISTAAPQLTGTATAGTSGSAAAADHVHPRAVVQPGDFGTGWKGWSSDPLYGATGNTGQTNSQTFVVAVPVDVTTTLSNAVLLLSTVAVTPTAGNCFVGIYSATGSQLAVSADISSIITGTTGYVTIPMTAPTSQVTAGSVVYVAVLTAAATQPTWGRGPNLFAAAGGSLKQRNGSLAGTQTSLPSSFTPASLGQSSAAFWAAVS